MNASAGRAVDFAVAQDRKILRRKGRLILLPIR